MFRWIFILGVLLPIINIEDVLRYRFDDIKFVLYDIGTSILTIYYFYNKKEFKFSYIGILIFLILFAMFISMFQSVNLGYSFKSIFRFLNTIIFITLIYELLSSKEIKLKKLTTLVSISSSIFLIYYLYGVYFDIFGSRNSFSPIGHVNYTAQVLNIWIPLLLLNFYIQKNSFFKYSSIILIFIFIDILLISMIRGSILSIVLSEIAIFLFIIIKKRKVVIYPIITTSLIILFLLNKIFSPSIIEKHIDKNVALPSNLTKIDTKTINRVSANRLNIYNNTIDMIIDNPFGVGIGNFEYIHPKYAKVGTPYATNYVNEFEVFTNPHNIILNFTSELGWFGGFIFIVIVFYFIKITIFNILNGDKIDYIIAIAFFTNLLHSMLSAIFLTPVNLFFTSLVLSILLYRYSKKVNSKVYFTLKIDCLRALLFLIPIYFSIFYISKYYCNQFTVQRKFEYIKKATLFNPFNEYAYLKYARYEAYANRDYSLAIYFIDKMLKLYPYNINGLIKKAIFEYKLKRYQKSLKIINKLLLIDKTNKKMLKLKDKIRKMEGFEL